MNIERHERELFEARRRYEDAVREQRQRGGDRHELLQLHDEVLHAERALAAAKGEPYAVPWPWPEDWTFSIEPSPLVLGDGLNALVLYEALGTEPVPRRIAILTFEDCESMKLGAPNDEVIEGHPLFGKGIDVGGAYMVENSPWLGELEAMNRNHPQYDPAVWRALRHYLLFFKDYAFECVARQVSSQIVEGSMREVLPRVALGGLC